MTEDELKNRFKQLALAVIRMVKKFPKEDEYKTIKQQIIDSSTSAAANYRAACRGKSTPDFINKLKIVEEETDETMFWLELTVGVDDKWRADIAPLYREANELLSITVASIKTARNSGGRKS